jgi:hypothetical protein
MSTGRLWQTPEPFLHASDRASQRVRTFKGGSIRFDLVTGLECLIRNLSESGAMVEVKGMTTVPDQFTLIIKPEIIRRLCVVEWRVGQRIGVTFIT